MGGSIQAFLLATLSAVFNGSFASCAKFTKTQIDPILFTFYNCIGVLLSSFLVIPFLPQLAKLPETSIYHSGSDHFLFSYLGASAGSLYVIGIICSFAAVQFVGIGIAQGVWGGAAILVSFLWGVLALGDTVDSVGVACLSLLTLMLGTAGIACNDVIADLLFPKLKSQENVIGEDPLLTSLIEEGYPVETNDNNHSNKRTRKTFTSGILSALGVGLFGGSVLVPMAFVGESLSGLAFLPSFGIGVIITSTLILSVYYGFIKRTNPFESFTLQGFLLGILSGIIWNLGNVCSIFAILGLGYAIAYPIFQCALFFAGLWGIFVFKEITGKSRILVFFLSGIILLSGAVVLSVNTNL